jgi:hypothetical protein
MKDDSGDKPKPVVKAVTPDRKVVQGQFQPKDVIDTQLFNALFSPDNLKKWLSDLLNPSAGKRFALRMDEVGLISREDLEASLQRVFHQINIEPPTIVSSRETTALLQLPIRDFITIQDRVRALSNPSKTP